MDVRYVSYTVYARVGLGHCVAECGLGWFGSVNWWELGEGKWTQIHVWVARIVYLVRYPIRRYDVSSKQ